MKRRRRAILGIMGLVVGVLLWVALRPREPEPSYQGRNLSKWLIAYIDNRYAAPDLAQRATNAVHHIGTNALPLLVKWMKYQPPKWRERLVNIAGPPAVLIFGRRGLQMVQGPDTVRAGSALAGFEILGKEAAPAIPALTELLGSWKSQSKSESALLALMFVGKDGLPALLTVVTNKAAPPWYRCNAAERIAAPIMKLGTNEIWVVQSLLPCLEDTAVAACVANVVGSWKLDPIEAVPALAKCLRSPDILARVEAAGALEQFGTDAYSAVPNLLSAITNKEEVVRATARSALQKIAPDVLKNDAH